MRQKAQVVRAGVLINDVKCGDKCRPKYDPDLDHEIEVDGQKCVSWIEREERVMTITDNDDHNDYCPAEGVY